MTSPTRPMPMTPEPDTDPFWAATREGRLTYQRCGACDGVVFHPRRHCTHCGSSDLRWLTSRGSGAIYTYTVIRRQGHPFFRARLPYVLAYVDLDEGFRMLAEVAADPDSVRVGQRVEVGWEEHERLRIPIFHPRVERSID